MKTILRGWLKDKTACGIMAVWFLSSILYTILNARVVVLISLCITELVHFQLYVTQLVVICIVQMIISGLSGYLRPYGIGHCFNTLRIQFSDKLLHSDMDMYTKYSCAHINVTAGFLNDIMNGGKELLLFLLNVSNICVLFYTMYTVAGIRILMVIAVVYAIGGILARYLFKVYGTINKKLISVKKRQSQEFDNLVYGFTEVRSFHTQEYHLNRVRRMCEENLDLTKKRSKIQFYINASFESVDAVGLILVILFVIHQMSLGLITQAGGISLVMLVLRVLDPIAGIMDFVDQFSEFVALEDSYNEIMNFQNETMNNGTINMSELRDSISMKDVSFAYDSTAGVLNHVNMTFPKGKKIGICGVSGVGKSTIFKLLNRFYTEKSGEILVDGVNIHEISEDSFRQHVGSVHQENSIFPGTIRENVLYGTPNASEYELIEACKKANIYEFIHGLPDRFETKVGPRGLTLSGGQKQRIALSRLFLRDPDIILLDEATSALDNESESIIQDAIAGMTGKTIITIAHRLTTIQDSDIIYAICPDGKIESGTHEQLMSQHGEYYKLVMRGGDM